MENGVLVHGRGEEESVGEVSRTIEDLIRSELTWCEFSAGEGSENIFGTESYLITGAEGMGLGFVSFEGLLHVLFFHA